MDHVKRVTRFTYHFFLRVKCNSWRRPVNVRSRSQLMEMFRRTRAPLDNLPYPGKLLNEQFCCEPRTTPENSNQG